MNFKMNLNNLFTDSVNKNKGSLIVYSDVLTYTYEKLSERIKRLSSSLVNMGVSKGDVVAIADWDSHRYLEMYFSVPMIGATLMTCNIRLSKEKKEYTLNHSGAKFFFVHSDFCNDIQDSKDVFPNLVNYIQINEDDSTDDQYEALISAGTPEFVFPDVDEACVATLFYTSGTTGLPKGVFFTHRQLVLHTLSLSSSLGSNKNGQRLHNEDVYLPLTPMFHVHAWGLPYVATMMGLKQVYAGKYCAKSLCNLIEKEGVTFTHSVPTLLTMLLDEAEKKKANLGQLKVLVGGALLPQPLMERAVNQGIDVWAGYGMSETGPVIAVNKIKHGQSDEARCYAGQPIPFVDIDIVPEFYLNDGQRAVGEITVLAPWVTPSYFRDEKSTLLQWVKGRFYTGDIGYLNDNGTLVITDRKKDLIKSGGEWLSPSELEDRAREVDSVEEVAFIAWPDEKWGERPVAFVVPKKNVTSSDIRKRINKHFVNLIEQGQLSRFSCPDLIVTVEELPKTSVGKTDKKNLFKYLEKEIGNEY
ncbi:long-chain-fatty-acid--CoA ligase [Vibrio ostreicida]|uniref:long-chain-fatty-acid--CoA ligase n=1 Tax=Vibrio ostreicida TaxID=526588 RepID=UPI003B5B5AEA